MQWPTNELKDRHLQAWLKTMASTEPVLHHGLLAVQPKDQLVTGYFVLFKDRLDFWNAPAEAASGMRARGRIILKEVRSLDKLEKGSAPGFVLNQAGRKI